MEGMGRKEDLRRVRKRFGEMRKRRKDQRKVRKGRRKMGRKGKFLGG